jgi:hypothetical protein
MAVIAGVIALYQRHFDRELNAIQSKTTVWDQAGILDDESKQYILDVSRDLKDSYGLDLRVWTRTEPFEAPAPDGKTIFLGVDVPGNKAAAVFPPLVAMALGPDLPSFLARDHFNEYFERGDAATGVVAAVGLIYQALLDAQSGAAKREGGDAS